MNGFISRVGSTLFFFFFLLGVGALGYWVADSAKREAVLLRIDTLRKVGYSANLNAYQAESYARMLLAAHVEDPQQREAYKREWHKFTAQIDTTLAAYERTITREQPDTRQLFNDFVAKRKLYRETTRQLFNLLESGNREAALKLLATDVIPAYRKYTEAGDALFEHDITAGNRRASDVERVCTRAQLLTALVCIGAFLLGYRPPST